MQPIDPTIFGVDRLTLDWYRWIVYVVFVVVLAIALWILYDSQAKRKEAMAWRVLSAIGIIFIIPSLVLAIDGRFSQDPLALRIPDAVKLLPILGIVGGVIGIVALIGYVGWAKSKVDEEQYVPVYPPLPDTQSYMSPPPPAMPVSPPPVPGTKVSDAPPFAESVASAGPAKTEILHRPPPQMAWFVVRGGARAGKEFRLSEVTNIGRDATQNDIAIDDNAISRQHARVRLEEGKFVLYDLASANGTTVNGEKILKHELANGDQITIGETQFAFMQVANA